MSTVKENGASPSTDPETIQQLKDGLSRTQNSLSVLINLIKDHIPNANISGMLNNLNLQVILYKLFILILLLYVLV